MRNPGWRRPGPGERMQGPARHRPGQVGRWPGQRGRGPGQVGRRQCEAGAMPLRDVVTRYQGDAMQPRRVQGRARGATPRCPGGLVSSRPLCRTPRGRGGQETATDGSAVVAWSSPLAGTCRARVSAAPVPGPGISRERRLDPAYRPAGETCPERRCATLSPAAEPGQTMHETCRRVRGHRFAARASYTASAIRASRPGVAQDANRPRGDNAGVHSGLMTAGA